MKRISAFLLMVVLCMSMIMPAFAASASQDGLNVTLTTNKKGYQQGEQIQATLTVTNTNDYAVSNVSLENITPDGYKLSEGTVPIKDIGSLAAGETVSFGVTYIPEGSANDIGNESKPENSPQPETGTNTDISNGSGSNSVPQTGDHGYIELWCTLMAVTAAGVALVMIRKKKNGKQFLSFFLALVMVGTMFSGGTFSVKAAEAMKQKEVKVSEIIQIGDSESTISAVVKYSLPSSESGEESEDFYTVTFDANGGTASGSYTKVAAGSEIGTLPSATREGYTFLGWYTEKSGGTQITSSTIITSDLTVYAQWNPIETGTGTYRITFDKNYEAAGVHQVQKVNMGQTAVEPVAPTRELYRFTGWYMESEAVTKYDFDTPITGDLTLYAGWGNPDGSDDDLYAASNQIETIFSISDIYVDHDDVTITYNTNHVSLVSVEFFADQMETGNWSKEQLNNNLNLEPIATVSGYTEVYGELATITLPISAQLPEYFLVRARMSDSESNSTEYTSIKYTQTYAQFEA